MPVPNEVFKEVQDNRRGLVAHTVNTFGSQCHGAPTAHQAITIHMVGTTCALGHGGFPGDASPRPLTLHLSRHGLAHNPSHPTVLGAQLAKSLIFLNKEFALGKGQSLPP